MAYLKINQRRVKEIELSRWVNYFLQIPLEEFKTINAFILNHAQLSNSPSAYKPKTYLMRDSFRGYYKIG